MLSVSESRKQIRDMPVVCGSVKFSERMEEYNKHCEENIQVWLAERDKETGQRTGQKIDKISEFGISKAVEEAILDRRLVNNLEIIKVKELNAMQRKAICLMRTGKSLMLQAPTGIGKTYTFLIPAIEKALQCRNKSGSDDGVPAPTVLILSSTGRLATQTFTRCSLILGLQNTEYDVMPVNEIKLERLVAEHVFPSTKCDIIFATMGKLMATIDAGGIKLDRLKMLILDEADKMTDESSFGHDVDTLWKKIPEEFHAEIQIGFFSATYVMTADHQFSLTQIQTKLLENKDFGILYCPRLPGYITQRVIRIPPMYNHFHEHPWIVKMSKVHELIDEQLAEMGVTKEGPFTQTMIIFCETVQMVDMVTAALCQLGFKFKPMSRHIMKDMQEIYLTELANCDIQGLVCTNILARGIDVASVKHVSYFVARYLINCSNLQTIVFEMATDFATYKHRIGRVGRDGSGGQSTVFLDDDNLNGGASAQIVEELVEFMKENDQELPDWLQEWYTNRLELYRQLTAVDEVRI